MHFNRLDLQQLTPEYISKLPPERLMILCEELRQDLIKARDRLNQNPSNSSRPSSTRAPWDRQSKNKDFEDDEDPTETDIAIDPLSKNEDDNDGEAKLRLHLTISKTKELLECWFGISLSKGCISKALLEAGRAASCLEPEIIAALRASSLLHVDETSWKEHKISRWLWVAVGDKVVYFCVGLRTLEMAQKIIGDFKGRLMTDGYNAYRWYSNRGRCWSHLQRKAKALEESCDKDAANFGCYMGKAFKSMQDYVYKMRKMQPGDRTNESKASDDVKIDLLMECLKHRDSKNEKVCAFAGEILNDNQAIFRILKEPDFPLTNNAAERALRPLVILRKISYGSKTDEGSRSIAILASTAETVRLRGHAVWTFFSSLFRAQRSGCSPPPLPDPIFIPS